MKRVVILGSTGSIGRSALEVVRSQPLEFKVLGLSTNADIQTLSRQIKEFHPEFVCVQDYRGFKKIKSDFGRKVKVLTGQDGLIQAACDKRSDKILLAISQSAALRPLLAAVESGQKIALANKEALVMAGEIIMSKARKNKAKILPVDSEQSAIWQCLDANLKLRVKNILLTASGGPFLKVARKELKDISVDKVLKHPRWKMGKKITVDSATMMNKGLEVLEAMHLFNMPLEKIKVVIHPEAIIHSMVEYIDGVILAQLSVTDMRIPIQYAFSYPDRLPSSLKALDLCKLRALHFEAPDFAKFPCLDLAFYAAKAKGTMPAVLNAANEICVNEFLKGRIKFLSIAKVIEKVLNRHKNKQALDLSEILNADKWARLEACRIIGG